MVEENTRKSKPLGGGIRAGSSSSSISKEAENGSNANRWIAGIEAQLGDSTSADELESGLDVQAVPLENIKIDDSNPRELAIEPDEIRAQIGILKLPTEAYGEGDEWIATYEGRVKATFGDTKKADDCIKLAMFAASLKSPKNIMAPICTWREETTFYLFAGERRYLAHFFMGASHAITRIWHHKPNAYEIKILEWQENHEREDLSVHEKLTNMRQILRERKIMHPEERMTVRTFSRIISIGKSQAGVWFKLATCTNELLNSAIKSGVVNNVNVAYELAGLDSAEIEKHLKEVSNGQPASNDSSGESSGVREKAKVKKSLPSAQVLRLNKKANLAPARFIVSTVAESIGDDELKDELDALNLEDPKGLTKALSVLLEFIESKVVEKK